MPKIAHLSSVHPPFDVRIFHKECKSLARAGYDVILIASHNGDEVVEGIRLRAIERPSGRLSRMLKSTWAVWREAVRVNADLYHFHDPELIPVGLLLRLKGKRVVYDVHENVPADIASKYYIPRPARRVLGWIVGLIEKQSSRHFSALVSATGSIGLRFETSSTPTVVINNYPFLEQFDPNAIRPWESRSTSVAYAGLLSSDRCIQEIIEAMGLLPDNLQATLKLAGSFSPPDYVTNLEKQKGWRRTEMLGNITRKQVDSLLADCRAGLCVYRPVPNNVDSSPNKLFEYMRAGLPVIASDFPGFRTIVDTFQCGVLVNPLEPNSIKKAIEYILHHPSEAQEMGRRGMEAVAREFNWAREESKLLSLYEDLLAPRPAA